MAFALFYCFIAALCYAVYPVMARKVGINAIWLAILLNSGGLVVALVRTAAQGTNQNLTTRQIFLGCVIGIIAGIGTLFYSEVMTLKGIDISKLIPITLAMMPVMAVILASIFLKEEIFTLKKMIAYAMIPISIYLLATS